MMLFGMPPWSVSIPKYQMGQRSVEDIIVDTRKRSLDFPDISGRIVDFDESILPILKKSLAQNPDERFQSANEFIQVLKGEVRIENINRHNKILSEGTTEKTIPVRKAKGKGFEAIAGMQELKEQMKVDVIDALNNPEEYAKYGISIPNGMLLYGPPGCGKTFFAKHFAEEVGFNYIEITPSALKSRYVNATQENIAKMFKEAEEKAPTIIFIDEINELLPNRDSNIHEMYKSAVNEMLAQMDRTGEKGIFIIGATNYPNMIDPAMLRSGRLEKKFYLPPPDFEARKGLFKMYLENKPLDFGIDYDKLAILTENYVSSDIDFLAKEAARTALKSKSRITMLILENTIRVTKPSVSSEELKKYKDIKEKINNENNINKNPRPRIGFI
jgi:transitional endoplasmic reticulum ATPase